jgi:DNA-binding transcriptional MerR regulator
VTVSGVGGTAPAPRGPAAGAALMSIGEVLAHLRGDFPDVTISKLRFLEAEGLVEPRRTSSGYRKYSSADVSRLRFVLSAQRDRYLPLRVIREQLDALDRGEAAAAVARSALGPARPALVRVDDPDPEPAELRLSRAELLHRSGLAEPVLAELEQHGLVRASGGRYDTDGLAVARVAAQLAEYGLEPRHLRAYRAAADREVGLFTQLVAPVARQSTPAARARAAETVRELAALSQLLHAALVRMGLRETLGQ